MKKVIILAVVAILIAAACGMVLVKTEISNTGYQMAYDSTATMYNVGTSTYSAVVLPINGVSAWSHLEQEAELEVDKEYSWPCCFPKYYNEIEQDTTLQYNNALVGVDTTTTQYWFGTVTQEIDNVGTGTIDTFQFIKVPRY
jgi:hypothetical protein